MIRGVSALNDRQSESAYAGSVFFAYVLWCQNESELRSFSRVLKKYSVFFSHNNCEDM